MNHNINSGYAKALLNRMGIAKTAGKTFIVGKSALAYSSMYRQMFINDKDGTVRYAATIGAASALCTANSGDQILCLPGHTETISSATALTLSVAGVKISSLGYGGDRATFTLDTAATATINVTAANVNFENCIFIANFADIASCFTLTTAKDFTVSNCEFRDTSSILNFLSVVTTSATNNQADGLTFVANYVYSLPATDGAVVSILANTLRLTVTDNIVDKAATNDAGHMITLSSKIVGGARILRNILTVTGSSGAAVGIFLTGSGSTSSGVVGFNNVWSLDTTGGLLMTASTGLRPMQNYLSGAADKSGTLTPVADDPA
jgi:hypothetical protein